MPGPDDLALRRKIADEIRQFAASEQAGDLRKRYRLPKPAPAAGTPAPVAPAPEKDPLDGLSDNELASLLED